MIVRQNSQVLKDVYNDCQSNIEFKVEVFETSNTISLDTDFVRTPTTSGTFTATLTEKFKDNRFSLKFILHLTQRSVLTKEDSVCVIPEPSPPSLLTGGIVSTTPLISWSPSTTTVGVYCRATCTMLKHIHSSFHLFSENTP